MRAEPRAKLTWLTSHHIIISLTLTTASWYAAAALPRTVLPRRSVFSFALRVTWRFVVRTERKVAGTDQRRYVEPKFHVTSAVGTMKSCSANARPFSLSLSLSLSSSLSFTLSHTVFSHSSSLSRYVSVSVSLFSFFFLLFLCNSQSHVKRTARR